jgi:hypothetical protein
MILRSPAGVIGNVGEAMEAPDSWRQGMQLKTSASEPNFYAQELIDAALNGTRLPHC